MSYRGRAPSIGTDERSKLNIRQADRGDSRFLSWVIQEAARSHLEVGVLHYAIPEDAKRLAFIDAATCASPDSFFRYENFLIAEIEGRQVAALSGYEPAVAMPAYTPAEEEVTTKLGWTADELQAMRERFELIFTCYNDQPEERWVIEWVATVPEYRGRGIVNQLLLEILDRGRERGFKKAQIGYLLGNDRARRSYERVGFETAYDKKNSDFEIALACPGIACMHRDL